MSESPSGRLDHPCGEMLLQMLYMYYLTQFSTM